MATNKRNEELVILDILKVHIVALEAELVQRELTHKLYLQRKYVILRDAGLLGTSEH